MNWIKGPSLVLSAFVSITLVASCGGQPKAQFVGEVKTNAGPAVTTTEVEPITSTISTSTEASDVVTLTDEDIKNYKDVIKLLDAAEVTVPDSVRLEISALGQPATSDLHAEDSDTQLALFGFGRSSGRRQISAGLTNTLARLLGTISPSTLGNLIMIPLVQQICIPNGLLLVTNPTGTSVDLSNKSGCLKLSGAFFKPMGNGRTCMSCHFPLDSWGINSTNVQKRFAATQGMDPLFRPVDGAVCPTADVSTVSARRNAYSLLLNKALIRIELAIPDAAEFSLKAATGTYCNDVSPERSMLSMFRRPLPTTNLEFITSVMWDGRESVTHDLSKDLAVQASHATTSHAQARSPSAKEISEMVSFERSVTSAQIASNKGFNISSTSQSAAAVLAAQKFTPNQNISPFNKNVFSLFDPFANSADTNMKSIYRGQQIFNTRNFTVNGVGRTTTCSSCHNTPNVGTNSAVPALYFNTGVASEQRRSSDLPLYTLVSVESAKTIKVSDPGRAMVTGKWDDIGKFKVPGLRGLAARAPYFHNGLAATVSDVVAFYDSQYQIRLTLQDRLDLTAFLSAL
jgi:cytochrome c peroxidase